MSKEYSDKYRNVSIKTEFADEIEKFINANPRHGYRSIAQFLEDAARRRLEDLAKQPFRFEEINHDENGVKIFDRQQHRIAEIFFKPKGIWCDLCEKSSCNHIEFALSNPDIQEIIKKKRKEGWKL